MKVRILAGGAVVVIVAVVAAFLIPWGGGSSGLPSNAAFRIGGRVITVAELNARDQTLTALYGVQAPASGTARDQFNRQAAKSMAISLVLDQAIAAHRVSVPDTEVQQAQAALITSQFGGSQANFTQELSAVKVSEATVVSEIRRQLELRVLLTQVGGNVTATDAEVTAAFPTYRASLGTPERRVVYNIVVATRAAADQVRKSLQAGAAVTTVAKEVSIDGATRNKGGLLGTVAKAQLLPAVGDAVFAIKAGGVYGPVEGTQGWNVGEVSQVLPSVPATLKSSFSELRTVLVNQKKQAIWTKWLSDQLHAAHIQYASGYQPKDPYDVSAWTNPDASPTNGQGQ